MKLSDISVLILAGGLARRMRGADKGLALYENRPLIEHAIERLRPQCPRIVLSANRHRDEYAKYGYPVVADAIEGFAGPLAGIAAGLAHCETEWLVTAPCDSPLLPKNLIVKFIAAAEEKTSDIYYAKTATRSHPMFAMLRKTLRNKIEDYLNAGERKVETFYLASGATQVLFDDEKNFRNFNTIEDLSTPGD
jgi:molybdopterin-guanine dinucleotide biosynthesis protein A